MQQTTQKHGFWLSFRHPDRTIKHRTDERLRVEVEVHARDTDPRDLTVELWAPLHDKECKKEAAYTLAFRRKEGDALIFGNDITLPYPGHFPLRARARKSGDKHWSWTHHPSMEGVTLWVDPAWVTDAIVYNAFVRYFGGRELEADGELKRIGSGTFAHLEEEMDRLESMHIDILYLNPVHKIGELYRYHDPNDLLPEYLQPGCPYSIKDYKSIDPELSFGEDEANREDHPFDDFRRFVDAAHKRGMRVFMDLVFNHSAHDSEFQRRHPEWYLYKEDITDLEGPYLYPEDMKEGKPWGDPKHTFAPYDHGWWWRDTAQINWNNLTELPDFIMPHVAPNDPPANPTIEDMYAYFINVAKFWVREFGIDGFRCDVAYRVPRDFWKRCILEVQETARKAHPHNGSVDGTVVFIAEDYHVDCAGLLECGFTACYGDFSNKLYDLPAITGYLDYMYNISGPHFPENSMWFIFPECHDFHRAPSKFVSEERKHHGDADLNANKSRWTITATLPGIPMIFNGFEKIEWEPVSLFSYSKVDWESDKDISEHIERVNRVRKAEPALQRGAYWYLHTSEGIAHESKLFSFARILDDECVIVCVNLDIVEKAEHITVYLPDALPIDYGEEYVLTDLLTGEEHRKTGKELPVILEPGEAHIFKVSQG